MPPGLAGVGRAVQQGLRIGNILSVVIFARGSGGDGVFEVATGGGFVVSGLVFIWLLQEEGTERAATLTRTCKDGGKIQ